MRKFLNSILLFFLLHHSYGQNIKASFNFKTEMSVEVSESSGLHYIDGTLWTFNDSGGEPILYAIDTSTGKVLRKVRINNAMNIDWEAIATDGTYIYIGDVGNNAGLREKLNIYRIKRKELLEETTISVNADVITFSYHKQHGKKAVMHKSFYDCEAIFCYGDSMYLINKNWINQSVAVVYSMPKKPGSYNIKPVLFIPSDGLICDAAVSENGKMLAVVGYIDYLPFLTLYEIGEKKPLVLTKKYDTEFVTNHGLQTEGITFIKQNELMISSESNKFFPNSLYKVILK